MIVRPLVGLRDACMWMCLCDLNDRETGNFKLIRIFFIKNNIERNGEGLKEAATAVKDCSRRGIVDARMMM